MPASPANDPNDAAALDERLVAAVVALDIDAVEAAISDGASPVARRKRTGVPLGPMTTPAMLADIGRTLAAGYDQGSRKTPRKAIELMRTTVAASQEAIGTQATRDRLDRLAEIAKPPALREMEAARDTLAAFVERAAAGDEAALDDDTADAIASIKAFDARGAIEVLGDAAHEQLPELFRAGLAKLDAFGASSRVVAEQTALHIAVLGLNAELVRMCLDAGCDPAVTVPVSGGAAERWTPAGQLQMLARGPLLSASDPIERDLNRSSAT